MPDLLSDPTVPVSPLMLADRLISLARDADRAGYASSASMLVELAYSVFDEMPNKPH